MLTLTERATDHVRRLLERDGKSTGVAGLRVKVAGGGCSGMQYVLTFDDAAAEGDLVLEFHGIRVFVDGKSKLFLNGTQIDYDDGLMGQGFRFSNPNAKGSCGCGESFHV